MAWETKGKVGRGRRGPGLWEGLDKGHGEESGDGLSINHVPGLTGRGNGKMIKGAEEEAVEDKAGGGGDGLPRTIWANGEAGGGDEGSEGTKEDEQGPGEKGGGRRRIEGGGGIWRDDGNEERG